MKRLNHLTIIGGGSWATALVSIFSASEIHVIWHLRSSDAVQHIQQYGRNPNYLSFLQLNKEFISPVSDIQVAIQSAQYVLFAVPSASLGNTIHEIDPALMVGKILMVSIKGIIPEDGSIPSVFLEKRFDIPQENQVVLGGPCHAEEMALERKTYLTIASENTELAKTISDSIHVEFIKTIINNDPLGVEVAAILKNVIGIACGVANGLNYGDNFQAVLVSNAQKEVTLFLEALDHKQRELSNSSYAGDLLVTAYSEFSRNRTFGQMIVRGYTVHNAQAAMNMVAEGYYAVEGIYKMAQHLKTNHQQCISGEMPIISAVYRILYNKMSPNMEFKLLEQQLF
ncbi:MAG: NAD(P)H-dependent glycerol-3-phosphate dehydrogenase [Chitinophagaceae bacterium]